MIAVAAESYLTGAKSDPRYIKWVASYIVSTEESYEAIHYPMHRCTEEDQAKFYPADGASSTKSRALFDA